MTQECKCQYTSCNQQNTRREINNATLHREQETTTYKTRSQTHLVYTLQQHWLWVFAWTMTKMWAVITKHLLTATLCCWISTLLWLKEKKRDNPACFTMSKGKQTLVCDMRTRSLQSQDVQSWKLQDLTFGLTALPEWSAQGSGRFCTQRWTYRAVSFLFAFTHTAAIWRWPTEQLLVGCVTFSLQP